jgi:hypothetical protein
MTKSTLYAPIALFVYTRLNETQQTIEHLLQNNEAKHSTLYIFSDGAKDTKAAPKVAAVRHYLKTIKGFKSIHIIERPCNYYLERNIIEGIQEVFKAYDRVIVVEDDICTSPHFLHFMNEGLIHYAEKPKVMHISGFTHLSLPHKEEAYFTPHMGGWGWATWKNRWQHFVHYTSRAEALKGLTPSDLAAIEYQGHFQCLKSLDRNPIPWDICWEIIIYRRQGLCLTPSHTLVRNSGLNKGTHFNMSRLIGRYTYDRPYSTKRLSPVVTTITADQEIEQCYQKAFKNHGIHYTWLGKILRRLLHLYRSIRSSFLSTHV